MRVVVLIGCASLLLGGAGSAVAQPTAADGQVAKALPQAGITLAQAVTEDEEKADASERAGEASEQAAEQAEEQTESTASGVKGFFDRRQIGVQAGGGVIGFLNSDARDFIDTGGAYQVRALVGTRSPVAVELAYIGTANDIEALGLDEDASLLGNGAEAALRYNFMSQTWQPYLLVGAAWKRYNVIDDDFNTSASVNDDDNVWEFPLAAGLTWHQADEGSSGLIIDGRFDYRLSTGEDLLGGGDGGGPGLNNWTATLRAGWEF